MFVFFSISRARTVLKIVLFGISSPHFFWAKIQQPTTTKHLLFGATLV
jgi:hypothetical protein